MPGRCCWPKPISASAAASGCGSACSTAPSTKAPEIDLRPIDTGTEITFTHSRLQTEASRASHEWGWNGALDKLARHFTPAFHREPDVKHRPASPAG